ncbi:Gfo/Idh/MocA family protein [Haloarchaeobius sp. DFWS5]|uniref:Gfo/Idh/MocA family protein n=1 Tax=Haloarchaeobius sp. DFWS5 TaxID=3446114 RepID=UPI003EBE3251
MTARIGYVGLDHHHRAPYLESIAQLDCDVVACADPYGATPEALGIDTLADVPYYEATSELLDDTDIDLLWVTAANRETPALVRAAVERGVDVFTEKPAARTAADLEPLADRIRASDATVGLSYTWRGHPISKQLKELAAEGFYGDVRGFDMRFVASALDHRDTDHYLFDADASRGGIVQWLGVHWIDLLQWILDEPVVRVNAMTTHGTGSVDVEDGATIQLETESGAIGTHTCSYFLREGRYDTTLNVYGSDGRSRWDPMGSTFGFDEETTVELDSSADDWTATPHRQVTHEYTPVPGYGGGWGLSFFEQFLAARDGDAPNPADIADAIRVLRVLDAVYESAATDSWVRVSGQ